MAFTNETKYGYKDGDHVANHGSQFPVFARVVNGKLYAVAREDNPAHPTPGRFGNMFMCSREWLKYTVFAAFKSYGDLFEDKPNNVPDNSEPGSSFQKTSNVEGIVKAPVLETTGLPVNTTMPGSSTPATTTAATAATSTSLTNPLGQAFQSGQSTNAPSTASLTRLLGIAASVIILLGGLYVLLRSKSK